jgi:hypothetical protein
MDDHIGKTVQSLSPLLERKTSKGQRLRRKAG